MNAVGDWVVIKQYEAETKTEGGIIIPDKVAKKMAPARGKIVSAGILCRESLLTVSGECLFSRENAFTDVVDGETYVFVRCSDVIMCT